jgi:ribosomal protein S18 acetylase RimI-like enzyme
MREAQSKDPPPCAPLHRRPGPFQRNRLTPFFAQPAPRPATPIPTIPQPEILDLRHFSAAQLGPLLRDEADRWQRRLHWDYAAASTTLLDYIDSRVLPGFVALDADRRILGYTFAVFEAAKAVIGDVYAFHEAGSLTNPTCDLLLLHLLEMLQSTPGVERIESQLLMFPFGALAAPFGAHGFRSFPRLFMTCDLPIAKPGAPYPDSEMWERTPTPLLRLEPWHTDFYNPAADLIQSCYAGHMDANLNDQYRTRAGAQRFLHNIIRFPGCGVFDPASSFVLRTPGSSTLEGIVLCSRVHPTYGHITQLCINPTLRAKGLGQSLLRACSTAAASRGMTHLSLTVTEANTEALHLYHRNNFTTLHRFEAMVWDKSFLLT